MFGPEGTPKRSVWTHAGRLARCSQRGDNKGYGCSMVAHGERAAGQGAAVMTNSENGAEFIQEIVRSIAQEHGWVDYPLDWMDRNSA